MNAVIDRRRLEAETGKAERARPAPDRPHRYDTPAQEQNAKAVLEKFAPLLNKLAK